MDNSLLKILKPIISIVFVIMIQSGAVAQDKIPEKYYGILPEGCKINRFEEYSIIGSVSKSLYEAGEVTILDGEDNVILKGKYGFSDRFIDYTIDGIYFQKSGSGWNVLTGEFSVRNNELGSLSASRKKASNLDINPRVITYFEGEYEGKMMKYDRNSLELSFEDSERNDDVPIGFKLGLDSLFLPSSVNDIILSIDYKTMNGELFFPNNITFDGIMQCREMQFSLVEGTIYRDEIKVCNISSDKITMSSAGLDFFGNPEEIVYDRDENDQFKNLSEVKSFCSDRLGLYKLSKGSHVECIHNWNQQITSSLQVCSSPTKITNMKLTMSDGLNTADMSLSDFCEISTAKITFPSASSLKYPLSTSIFTYADEGEFHMTDGSNYIGKYVMRNGKVIFTRGRYLYNNGDVFEGDLQSNGVYGFPTDGFYLLKSGVKIAGNHFDDAHIEERHKFLLEDCKKPSDIYDTLVSLNSIYGSLKKYDGIYMGGHAVYYYYESDGSRIYDGPFHYYDTGVDVKGEFCQGMRTGKWTIFRQSDPFNHRKVNIVANYQNGAHHGPFEYKDDEYYFYANFYKGYYDGDIRYSNYFNGDVTGKFDKGKMVGVWKAVKGLRTIVYDFTGPEVVHYAVSSDTGIKSESHNIIKPDGIRIDICYNEIISDPANNWQTPSTYYLIPDFSTR